MEERELTRLLQQLGNRVTPGPPPLRRIVDGGEALRGRRSGRVRMFAGAAAAAAAVGGGSLAATVLDLPSLGGADEAESAGDAGSVMDDSGAGGGQESAPVPGPGEDRRSTEEDAAAADAAAVPVPVSPDVAGPGDRVGIAVPTDVAFGAEWSLERSMNGSWKALFILVDADVAVENGAPLSRRADSSGTLDDIRALKDGAVPLVVPDAATPGSYRICQTADDGTEWCGLLTITD